MIITFLTQNVFIDLLVLYVYKRKLNQTKKINYFAE